MERSSLREHPTTLLDIILLFHQINGMIKTQIQVPEKQYAALRQFAAEREWSLAETFRRGAELMMDVYPPHPAPKEEAWVPPSSASVGWKGLDPDALKRALTEDREPTLSRGA